MTKEQYDLELANLKKEFTEKKRALAREFAHANNPYKIGDTFTDQIGSIIIRKIQVYIGLDGYPSCAYTGDNLTKSGSISKKEPVRTAYQINDVTPSLLTPKP